MNLEVQIISPWSIKGPWSYNKSRVLCDESHFPSNQKLERIERERERERRA